MKLRMIVFGVAMSCSSVIRRRMVTYSSPSQIWQAYGLWLSTTTHRTHEILTAALRVFALRVDSVSSGEDAVREIAAADSQDPYRLVLMDWHMPGMDGLEASRIIKRDDRLQHTPKIVMVTVVIFENAGIGASEGEAPDSVPIMAR